MGVCRREQRFKAVAEKRWKTDSQVRCVWGGKSLSVVGYDSVGSVICRNLDDPRNDVYVPPSLLVGVDEAQEATKNPARVV